MPQRIPVPETSALDRLDQIQTALREQSALAQSLAVIFRIASGPDFQLSSGDASELFPGLEVIAEKMVVDLDELRDDASSLRMASEAEGRLAGLAGAK